MRSPDTTFFGHPAGLGFLASTQAWERFSFYGMQALLPLYLVDHLLKPEVAAGVAGLDGLRAGVEFLTGPLSTTAFAAQLFGLYIGLFNIAPLALGWLADGVFGQRRLVQAGLVFMAAGHLAMAVEALFLPALLLLLLGGGCLKGNLYAQVGMLYASGDGRRTRAYAIHLMALNVGSIVAPLVCGTLGERVGWHWGFAAAGIGMLLGLAIYVAGTRQLPPDSIRRLRGTADVPQGTDTAAIAAIEDCAVVGMPSEQWGETPVAFVVAATPLDGVAVKQWLNERLGKNQRVLDVIQIDQLPRSEIGKVLKRDLRDRYVAIQA